MHLITIILNLIILTHSYDLLHSKWSSVMIIYEHIESENGQWYLTLQDDGNLVGYSNEDHKPFFATNTSCYNPDFYFRYACMRQVFLDMQDDGNLVLYMSSTVPVWCTNTHNQGIEPYQVKMQNDRNIVLTDSNNTILWASNTTIENNSTNTTNATLNETCNVTNTTNTTGFN